MVFNGILGHIIGHSRPLVQYYSCVQRGPIPYTVPGTVPNINLLHACRSRSNVRLSSGCSPGCHMALGLCQALNNIIETCGKIYVVTLRLRNHTCLLILEALSSFLKDFYRQIQILRDQNGTVFHGCKESFLLCANTTSPPLRCFYGYV